MKSDTPCQLIARAGFTLIELLVVLVIVSLLSTVLYQSAGFLLGVYQRVTIHLERQRSDLLVDTWIFQTVSNLLPDAHQNDAGVRGDANRISFTSTMLLDEENMVGPMVWQLQNQTNGANLIYDSPSTGAWVVKNLGEREFFFRYQDVKGRWHEQWPPSDAPWGAPQGLLISAKGTREFEHHIPIYARWDPPPKFAEF